VDGAVDAAAKAPEVQCAGAAAPPRPAPPNRYGKTAGDRERACVSAPPARGVLRTTLRASRRLRRPPADAVRLACCPRTRPAAIPPVGPDIPVSEKSMHVSHRWMDSAPDSYPIVKHSFLFSKANVELQAGPADGVVRTVTRASADGPSCSARLALTQLHAGRIPPRKQTAVSDAHAAGGHNNARAAPHAASSITTAAPNSPGKPHPQKPTATSTQAQSQLRPCHVARVAGVTCAEWFPVGGLRGHFAAGQQGAHAWVLKRLPVGAAHGENAAWFGALLAYSAGL